MSGAHSGGAANPSACPRRRHVLAGSATMLLYPAAALDAPAVARAREPDAAIPAVVMPGAFEVARDRWRELLVGDGAPVRPAMRRRLVRAADTAGVAAYELLRSGAAGAQPFRDLSLGSVSAHVTTIYRRLRAIALACALPGTSLTGDADAQRHTLDAVRWMGANCYAPGVRFYDNWWDWQIGGPQALLDCLCLLQPVATRADVAAAVASVAHFVADPKYRRRPDGSSLGDEETAANLLDKVIVVLGAGLLSNDAAKVASAVSRVTPVFQYVGRGDGFYRDGSFIQHGNVPYIGGYGVPLITSLVRLLVVLAGSPWRVAGGAGNVWRWLRDSYAPFLHDGAMMDAVRGRSVSREAQSNRSVGRSVIAPMAVLAAAAPAAERAWIAAAVKGWMTRDGDVDAYGGTLFEASRLTDILADASVRPAPEAAGLALFPAMARGVLRGDGFAVTIAMFSPTIVAFEYGNVENPRGWWTGMGMTQIYDGDRTRYVDGYYPAVDFRRMPGTTTDHSGSGTPRSWGGDYFNPQSWVGGVSLDGEAGAMGMAFETRGVTGTDLRGRKSWFLWDGMIVAIGSDIAGRSGEIETVVENAKVAADWTPRLTMDGTLVPLGNAAERRPARWLHLATSGASAGTGVVLLAPTVVSTLLETRTGNWRDINRDGEDRAVTARFLSVAIPHDRATAAVPGGYAYLLLPERSALRTGAIAADQPLELLIADGRVHAVRDRRVGIVAANFWTAAGGTVAGAVSSSGRAAVIVRVAEGEIAVAVSSPGATLRIPITITVPRAAGRVLALGQGVTVLSTTPHLRLRVDATANGTTARLSLAA